jgi:WhiB family transcriptional regulator, redox-sensing transcriptional regulator
VSNMAGNLAAGHPKWARLAPRGTWAQRAACADTDPSMWFLDDQSGSYREARAICASCPVRRECLAWAVETNSRHGMFGGLNPLERRHLRRTSR